MTNLFIRSILLYIIVLFAIRFMGKRQVGEMQPFEFVITLILADLATIPMAEISVPILHGIVPILAMVLIHFLICFASRKSVFARYLISGRSAILINPNGINYQELKNLNMTLDDLIELLRGLQIFSFSDVQYAILETNGKLCCLKKSEAENVTREDLNIKAEPASLPITIIMDGKVMNENVTLAKVDNDFIDMCLKRAQAKSVKDIIILTLDNNGEVFIQQKKGSAMSFETDFDGTDKW